MRTIELDAAETEAVPAPTDPIPLPTDPPTDASTDSIALISNWTRVGLGGRLDGLGDGLRRRLGYVWVGERC